MSAFLGCVTMTFILWEIWKKQKYGYAYGEITIKKILACSSIGLLERNLVGLAIDYTSTLKLEKQLEQAKQLKPEELEELENELNNI